MSRRWQKIGCLQHIKSKRPISNLLKILFFSDFDEDYGITWFLV